MKPAAILAALLALGAAVPAAANPLAILVTRTVPAKATLVPVDDPAGGIGSPACAIL